MEVEVQTDSEEEDVPSEAGLWKANHDHGRVALFRFEQHQELVR